jgi:hypothetical protein
MLHSWDLFVIFTLLDSLRTEKVCQSELGYSGIV